jgi:hypothetical protein
MFAKTPGKKIIRKKIILEEHRFLFLSLSSIIPTWCKIEENRKGKIEEEKVKDRQRKINK